MPYPRHITFQKWKECPRCGLDWPVDQLSKDSTGVKVCPECYDIKVESKYVTNPVVTESTEGYLVDTSGNLILDSSGQRIEEAG